MRLPESTSTGVAYQSVPTENNTGHVALLEEFHGFGMVWGSANFLLGFIYILVGNWIATCVIYI
jgi:hypothetical protein